MQMPRHSLETGLKLLFLQAILQHLGRVELQTNVEGNTSKFKVQ